MKKLLIGILLTVPIVILLTTGLAATIISARVYINVERLELNEHEVVIDFEGGSAVVYDGLSAKIFPTGARNKNIIWTIEDIQFDDPELVDGETKIAEVDASGVVTIYCYGVFSVRATSAEGNKFDVCRFIVGGNSVTSMRFPAGTKTEYYAGETKRLEAVVFSVDALDKSVTWSVSGDAFTVSRNGIAEAVKPGKAVVTAVSNANPEVSASIELTCLDSAFKFTHLFTSQTEIPLSALVFPAYLGAAFALENCSVSGGNLNITAYPATMSLSGRTLEIESCEEDEITVEHAAHFASGFFLRVGGAPLYLKAVYRDKLRDALPEASFSSADETVATVSGSGEVRPVSPGTTKITVLWGGEGFTLSIKVVMPVTRLMLDAVYSTALDKAGIADERVFGTMCVEGGEVVNHRYINLRAPVDAPAEDFIWTVSGEGAAFESDASNKLIFDDEPFEGKKKITLSVRARYPLYQSIVPSASYTMTLVDSVNVGNLADFGRLAAEGYGLALTADIPVTTEYMDSFGPESVKRGTEIKKNLYGNGFAVYRALLSNNEHVGWADSIIKILTDNVTLENTTIRYGITDDAVSREKGSRAYLKFRWALRIANDNDTQRALKNINVRYCTVENAYNIVVSQHVDVHFKGSIIRNSPSSCLLIYSALPESGLTILEDMVFSNSTGIPINMMNDVGIICDNLEDIKSIYNCELNRLEMRGFVDIYNWKDAEKEGVQLFTVSDAIANHVGVDATTLQGIVDTLLTYLLKFDPAYESLRYIINDRMYFHTGIFVMGGTSPADINTITGAEQAGYTIHAVPVPDVVIGFEPTFTNICYLVSYDKERYAVGPDDIVDYSEDSALYSELRNGRK